MVAEIEVRDVLTGVYSRRSFDPRYCQELDRAQRLKENLSILVIDIDYFKSINDAYGHTRGDQVLRQFVSKIQVSMRGYDLLFRYGGDEFVMLLPNTSKKQAVLVASRILDAVIGSEFEGEPDVTVSVSIGLASFPEDTSVTSELFETADVRLLDAKHQGRGRVVSDNPAQKEDLPFERVSRWIEREDITETFNAFIKRLSEEKRGVLRVVGRKGSGRTRCLMEMTNSAKLRGFEVMAFEGNSGLKHRQFAALAEARKDWKYHLPACRTQEDFSNILEQTLRENGKDKLLITVDNLEDIDRSSLRYLRHLMLLSKIPVAALICTAHEMGSQEVGMRDLKLHENVECRGLSQEGLRIWLRGVLQWNPDDIFLDWIYRETKGLPAYVKKGLSFLVKRGVLEKEKDGEWLLNRDFHEVQLAEKIGVETLYPPHNIPSMLTEFVGREREIEELIQLIDEKRLVSLLGPGGIGKTRLSMQVALEKLRFFRDGVFFVPLADITSLDFIYSTLADSLDFSFSGAQDLKEQLIAYLQEKEMLLVWDNFEQLTSEAALVKEFLDECKELRILVTSRERLNLQGEWIYELKGMTVPYEDDGKLLDDYSAVQLFLQSARRADPRIDISEDNKQHIVKICNLVQGLPLAIELAAAWIRVISCENIADEIEKNMDFLETTHRDVPMRHRSLRAVFEHSWNLLSETEQTVIRKISVFHGGFNRDSAEKVAGASLRNLSSLLDKSLIYRSQTGRYFMLVVLKEYAGAKLDENEEEARLIRKLHSRYYAEYLKSKGMMRREQKEKAFLEQVALEMDNIRSGFLNAAEELDDSTVKTYISNMDYYFGASGMSLEGEQLLSKAVVHFEKASRESGDDEKQRKWILAYMNMMRGGFLYGVSRYDSSKALLEDSKIIFEELEDREDLADIYNLLAGVALKTGEYLEAKTLYQNSLKLNREIKHNYGIAKTLNNLAIVAHYMNNFDEAKKLYEESVEYFKKANVREGEVAALSNLGFLAGITGEYEKQNAYLRKCLDIYREIGTPVGIAHGMNTLGWSEMMLGNYEQALKLQTESLKIYKRIFDISGVARCMVFMGLVYKSQGNLPKARELCEESLVMYREAGNIPAVSDGLAYLGSIVQQMDGIEAARPLLDESLELSEHHGYPQGIYHVKLIRADGLLRNGEFAPARNLYLECLDYAVKSNSLNIGFEALTGLAITTYSIDTEQAATSAKLLSYTMNNTCVRQITKEETQKYLDDLKTLLAEDTMHEAMEEGKTLTFETAAEIFLKA